MKLTDELREYATCRAFQVCAISERMTGVNDFAAIKAALEELQAAEYDDELPDHISPVEAFSGFSCGELLNEIEDEAGWIERVLEELPDDIARKALA